ncbi:hypothetical protein C0993_005124, partial [Termitomyces sp. T159_Od127]
MKRIRAGVQNTPRGKGRINEVDTQILARLLKILERNVRAGEDVDPFRYTPPARAPASPSKKSPKKAARGKKADRRSKSKTPGLDGEGDDGEDHVGPADAVAELTDVEFDQLAKVLEVARDSIVAADCCIALLASDRLTKQ